MQPKIAIISKTALRVGIILLTPFLLLGAILLVNNLTQRAPQVKQDSSEVEVGGFIGSCILEVTIKPEKRIPNVGNDSTDITLDVYDLSDTLLGTVTGTTNNLGTTTMNICAQGLNLSPGTYNFRARGLSHLRKNFGDHFGFSLSLTTIDLSNGGTEQLLAGETSVVYDNYINSLDISTQINKIYTGDNKNDLNQDGVVNSLDFSNTIFNFYDIGD